MLKWLSNKKIINAITVCAGVVSVVYLWFIRDDLSWTVRNYRQHPEELLYIFGFVAFVGVVILVFLRLPPLPRVYTLIVGLTSIHLCATWFIGNFVWTTWRLYSDISTTTAQLGGPEPEFMLILLNIMLYIWFLAYVLGGWALLFFILRRHLRARRAAKCDYLVCLKCFYSLQGLPKTGKCPECGTEYTIDEIKKKWIDRLHVIPTLLRNVPNETTEPRA